MSKLGYTWYPKDWGNSESVFEMTLSERGLYRELIDLAMLNDNKTEIKLDVWSRKFAISIDELNLILNRLSTLLVIEMNDNKLFIPSCENRLNLVRGGSNGGKKSKPTSKPIAKPFESLDEKNEKPIPKQIEKKLNINEININESFYKELLISEQWIEVNAKNNRISPDKTKRYLTKFNDKLIAQADKKQNKTEYCSHFARWLELEVKKDQTPVIKKAPML